MSILIDDKVLRLEVSMNDLRLVQMFNCEHDLSKVELRLALLEVHLIIQHLA